jgi:hypothetical protein
VLSTEPDPLTGLKTINTHSYKLKKITSILGTIYRSTTEICKRGKNLKKKHNNIIKPVITNPVVPHWLGFIS